MSANIQALLKSYVNFDEHTSGSAARGILIGMFAAFGGFCLVTTLVLFLVYCLWTTLKPDSPTTKPISLLVKVPLLSPFYQSVLLLAP